MAFICYCLTLVFLIQRSYASYPSEGIEEEQPIAVAPQPIAEVEAAPIHAVAKPEYTLPHPVVAPAPAVAPAPVIAHAAPQPVVVQAQPIVQPAPVPVPYPVHIHHHNPRTEVRNIVSHYKKESGHTSATAMVSGDHHAFHEMDLHPAGHVFEDEHYAEPWKARKHHHKLASKKVARKHKVVRKHKVARKQKIHKRKN
ncbi:hypothetical protein Y032_0036g3177 [Ancylostoma ceylanicum]|uniref:Uncharacterized protein n=1 Tax=Ancylostoma ceylanicum TaxID=53326 RepID=A0A016UKQ7_9BILA|nr:hypothetical protein Y032_0036g3177 [Ancylostoma ceylanicum]